MIKKKKKKKKKTQFMRPGLVDLVKGIINLLITLLP
jgi:hypothetical protein